MRQIIRYRSQVDALLDIYNPDETNVQTYGHAIRSAKIVFTTLEFLSDLER